MSTLSEREAALRRALQSAAASIEPAHDGLERIQARLRRPRPTVIAWLEAAWTDFYLRARAGLQTAGPLVAGDLRQIWERFGPASAPGRGRALRWLRPLAALSLAAFVFGAGTYVGLNSSALFPSAPSLNSGTVGPGAGNRGGHGSQGPDGSGSPVSSRGPSGSSTSPSDCRKARKTPSYLQPTSTASGSTSPTSTGSPTPTITPSSTPTPTPSSSSSTTPSVANTTAATGGGTNGAAGTGQPGTTAGLSAGDTVGTSHARTTTKSSSTDKTPAHSKVSPSATASASPCATKTTAVFRPPEVVRPPAGHGTNGAASAQLVAARLEATGAAARLNRHLAT